MDPKQKVLILGGTEFVGRQLVETLLAGQTFELFLFNRGKTNPTLFPTVQKIIGDRETNDIEKINQHKWDYIIDFSSYFPKSLAQTLKHINRDVKKYIYISTISVYSFKDYDTSFEIKEDFKRRTYEKEQLTEPTLKYYGEKKSACEDILNNTHWLNAIILRPSFIYGKFDPTDRFYYWMERIKRKDKIIVPAKGVQFLSFTYSLDLVKIIIKGLSGELPNGTYNCTSNQPLQFKSILDAIKETLESNCELLPIAQDKLKAEKIPSSEFPFWFGGNIMFDNSKITRATAIEFSTLKESLVTTIQYYQEKGWPVSKVGISYEKEDKLIQQLSATNK